MLVPLRQFVADLQQEMRRGRVTFLVGAGVSMQTPSLLPSGPDLRDLVVENICGVEFRREWLALHRHSRYITKIPEIVFQQIYDCITAKLYPFFDVLKTAEPNSLHSFLAASCSLGAKLATTNFDLLLEAAAPGTAALHLHGDVGTPTVMAVRITQVGRGLHDSLQNEFARIVRGRTLCVLGYSGNDHDIAIACRLARPRKLMWLARNAADPAWSNMKRFVRPGVRVVAAEGDINAVGQALGWPLTGSRSRVGVLKARKRVARAASDRLTVAERLACLAEISFAIEEYAEAASLAGRGLRVTRNPNIAALLRSVAANALKVNGRFDEAVAVMKPITRLSQSKVAPYEYAVAQNALGTVWLERENYDTSKALHAFRLALTALNRVIVKDPVGHERVRLLRGRIHNNIGLALDFSDNRGKAAYHFRRSLEEKRRTGDLMGQAQALINLGLVHYAKCEFARARRILQKAAAIYEQYGFLFQKAYALRRLGTIAGDQGRRCQALERLHEALKVYEMIPSAEFGRQLTNELIVKYGR